MKKFLLLSPAAIALVVLALISVVMPPVSKAEKGAGPQNMPAKVEVFAPGKGDHAGIGGKGWFVDLAIDMNVPLAKTGFTAPQLTGPGAHNNVAPFPGTFSPGKDDRLPGLIVLISTSTVGAGPGQNLANLFNLTGPTDVAPDYTEIWDT